MELAWAAGFFDGEGSSGIQRRPPPRQPYMRLSVKQNERRPLDRFCAAVGEGRVYGPHADGTHVWVAVSHSAERALESLWPYLSEPKKEQAERVREELTCLIC